jgi:DNA primase
MILDHILRTEKVRADYEIVASPGANTFKPEHAKFLSARDVIILYDHDTAGESGIKRVVKTCSELVDRPTSIRKLVWSADKGKGYDIRDLFNEYKNE